MMMMASLIRFLSQISITTFLKIFSSLYIISKKLFTNELITEIITQTNLYANEQIAKKKLSTRNWKSILYKKMLTFFGMNMGTICLSDIKDYFSKDSTCNSQFLAKIFKEKRFFLQIFWMLHIHQNLNNNNYTITKFSKVKNFLDIDLKFQTKLCSRKRNVCGQKCKGRFNCLTYNFNKPTKQGIRMYMLADSNTGYVYSILPYLGSVTLESLIYPGLSVSARIVLHLYNNLIPKDIIFMSTDTIPIFHWLKNCLKCYLRNLK